MATLYKRATPAQARVFRIIEGAVKNASDAHPAMKISNRFARSIAKRATGTLTAQWPEVLAALPSENGRVTRMHGSSTDRAQLNKPAGRGSPHLSRRSPLRTLHSQIGIMARNARHANDEARLSVLVEVLKLIAKAES